MKFLFDIFFRILAYKLCWFKMQFLNFFTTLLITYFVKLV
jgi:hypothetical protein